MTKVVAKKVAFEDEQLSQEDALQVDRRGGRGGSCHGRGEEEGEQQAGEEQQDGLEDKNDFILTLVTPSSIEKVIILVVQWFIVLVL